MRAMAPTCCLSPEHGRSASLAFLISPERDRAFACKHEADLFPHKVVELRDTTVRPVAGPASWESVVFQVQGFSNHVLAQGQLSSAEGAMGGGRRKIY